MLDGLRTWVKKQYYVRKAVYEVKREMREETGLKVKIKKLFGVYSTPGRDPRGHTVGIVYICGAGGKLKAGDDAKEAFWVKAEELRKVKLAFDHNKIISDYLRSRKRKK